MQVFEGWDYEEIIPPSSTTRTCSRSRRSPRRRTRLWAGTETSSRCGPDFRACWPRSPPGGSRDRPARYASTPPARSYARARQGGRRGGSARSGLDTSAATPGRPTRGPGHRRQSPWIASARRVGPGPGPRRCVLRPGGGLAPRRRAPRGAPRARRGEGRRGRAPSLEGAGSRPGDGGRARAVSRDGRRARGPRRSGARLRLLPARRAGRGRAPAWWRGPCGRRGSPTHLAVDLGGVRGLDYYTGLVFRVFTPGLGFEDGGGGRGYARSFAARAAAAASAPSWARPGGAPPRAAGRREAGSSPARRIQGGDLGAALSAAGGRRPRHAG